MHIVLANRWFPPHSGFGGVAMYNYYLSRALVQLGHRVTVISSRASADAPSQEEVDGVDVHRLLTRHPYRLHRLPFIGRYMRSIQELLYSYRVARRLRRLMAVDTPDVVEFAEVRGEGFAYLRRQDRVPVVVRCHTPTFVLRRYHRPDEMPYDTSLTEWMEKAAIRRADALTAPSRDMAETVARDCGLAAGRINVIPNALDVDLFSPDGPAEGKRDEVTVLHVGRLDRVKGIGVLARAIPSVVERAPDVQFVFIGAARSDHETATWGRRLARAGEEQVTILGFLEEAEMRVWYQRADMAVVPSLNYESFSYTCAQAMAAGLPVVASRIGGIPETLDHGASGLLVEPGNVKALADALVRLVKEPNLSRNLGKAGQHKAAYEFDASRVGRQMLEVYHSVVSTRRRPGP
jgi:glycosyltransferase involved in cell wall biosynthesis